jgi:hypothetical protein
MKDDDSIGLFVLVVAILIFIGIIYGGTISNWFGANWIWLTITVASVVFVGIVFYVKIILSTDKETDAKIKREEELKKAIWRKEILLEKEQEWNRLDLTREEREYQIEKLIAGKEEEEFQKKYWFTKGKRQPTSLEEESPISQGEKEPKKNQQVICKYCDTYYDVAEKKCPHCGARRK